jgi:imidazolonepropionase-like amidohydrolase
MRGTHPWLALLLGLGLAAPGTADVLVVEADVLHTVSGETLRDAAVVVEDGRIRKVGNAEKVAPSGEFRRLRARVVTPGLIDVHTSVGLAGLYNVRADRDSDETSGSNQADLRAIDAFNPREPLLRYLLEHGVTLVQTGPGPANAIGGQAGIFRTYGELADSMAVRSLSALVFSLGEQPKSTYAEKRGVPTTRMATAALIREALQDGLAYRAKLEKGKKEKRPDRDLKREVLAQVASGEVPAIFVAHRADDIATAIRITKEFGLRAFIAGGTEAYLVAEEVRASGIPVLVGPVMTRVGSPETENATYENAAILVNRGILLAIRSGYESYVPRARVVLFEAAIAAANGLGFDRALRAITLDAAGLLGVAEDYGSVDEGKVADLVLFDGDPFEYTSQVVAVIAAGEPVYVREVLP